MDKGAILAAAKNSELECLKYAVEHGCPIDMIKCIKNAKGETMKYLESLKEGEYNAYYPKKR